MAGTVTHLNYSTVLYQSDNPRGATPTGNIYFNLTTGELQIITADEQATFINGGNTITNALTRFDGVTMRALYDFESARRKANSTLQNVRRFIAGTYRFAGAYNFVNGRKAISDRAKIRSSGWNEYAADATTGNTLLDRSYHGIISLVDIQDTSAPYYALTTATDEATLQSATWTNFTRAGDINEAVQVYGTTANGDTTAGNFDYRSRTLAIRVRTWQYNSGETTSTLTGISEFSGFSAGYGVGETANTNNTYALADVYGASRVAPFTGLSLEKTASPQTVTGFNEGSGTFTWALHNTGGATANQCAAYLDALSLQDADIDAGTGTYNGKKGRVWYTRNTAGKIVTNSIGGAGLIIEGLSATEKQNVIQTTDAATTRTYPFYPTVQINVGTVAPTDPGAWYRVVYADGAGALDFNTAAAVTVKNSSGVDVAGTVAANASGNLISFQYDYDNNTQAGLTAATDKAMVVQVEGNGVAAQAITYFTVTRTATISVTCAPGVETNA